MALNGSTVVLQLQEGAASPVQCRTYGDVAATASALIRIVPATARAAGLARELFEGLEEAMRGIASPVHAPGHELPASALDCEAHDVIDGVRLLVVVGDGSSESSPNALCSDWLCGRREHRALALLPACLESTALLPPAMRSLDVTSWDAHPVERRDEILGAAGVAPLERRVFLHYRRDEASGVAEQLLGELPQRGFEVFVNRFRAHPGFDFQERLSDELADKSMVLVIESGRGFECGWIEHELSFAKKHDLGRLALHLPGAARSPWLGEAFRLSLFEGDMEPEAAPTNGGHLSAAALDAALKRVIEEDARATLRRRGFLLDTLRAALITRGLIDQRIDARGHLSVRVGGHSYALWTSSRPPRVADFRRCSGVCAPGPDPTGCLVTTSVFSAAERRAEMDWLARAARVQVIDEGRIAELADSILKTGSLP